MSMPDIAVSTMLCTPRRACYCVASFDVERRERVTAIISPIVSTSAAIGLMFATGETEVRPPDGPGRRLCTSISIGADVSAPLPVCSGMLIGASTQRMTTARTVGLGMAHLLFSMAGFSRCVSACLVIDIQPRKKKSERPS